MQKVQIEKLRPRHLTQIWKKEGTKIGEFHVTVMGVRNIFRLDPIASFVWLLLDGRHTVEEIIEKVRSNFSGAKKSQVRRDVIRLLRGLDQDDLIVLEYDPLNSYKEFLSLRKIPRE